MYVNIKDATIQSYLVWSSQNNFFHPNNSCTKQMETFLHYLLKWILTIETRVNKCRTIVLLIWHSGYILLYTTIFWMVANFNSGKITTRLLPHMSLLLTDICSTNSIVFSNYCHLLFCYQPYGVVF